MTWWTASGRSPTRSRRPRAGRRWGPLTRCTTRSSGRWGALEADHVGNGSGVPGFARGRARPPGRNVPIAVRGGERRRARAHPGLGRPARGPRRRAWRIRSPHRVRRAHGRASREGARDVDRGAPGRASWTTSPRKWTRARRGARAPSPTRAPNYRYEVFDDGHLVDRYKVTCPRALHRTRPGEGQRSRSRVRDVGVWRLKTIAGRFRWRGGTNRTRSTTAAGDGRRPCGDRGVGGAPPRALRARRRGRG